MGHGKMCVAVHALMCVHCLVLSDVRAMRNVVQLFSSEIEYLGMHNHKIYFNRFMYLQSTMRL